MAQNAILVRKNTRWLANTRGASILVMMLMAMMVAFGFSAAPAQAATNAEAHSQLTSYVYSAVSANQYQLEGGGFVSGSDLMEEDPNMPGSYQIDDVAYSKLSGDGKNVFVSDVVKASNETVEGPEAQPGGSTSSVSDATLSTWFKQIQNTPGVGTKMLNQVLENVKPDFVTANEIFKPFSGIFGTVMGLVTVLIFALLGVTIALDLAYITIPAMRVLGGDSGGGGGGAMGGGGGGKKGLRFISDEAKAAVENNADSGTPLWTYFKKRAFAMFILAICLVFLVGGQMWTLVAAGTDLVSGFFGGA